MPAQRERENKEREKESEREGGKRDNTKIRHKTKVKSQNTVNLCFNRTRRPLSAGPLCQDRGPASKSRGGRVMGIMGGGGRSLCPKAVLGI